MIKAVVQKIIFGTQGTPVTQSYTLSEQSVASFLQIHRVPSLQDEGFIQGPKPRSRQTSCVPSELFLPAFVFLDASH